METNNGNDGDKANTAHKPHKADGAAFANPDGAANQQVDHVDVGVVREGDRHVISIRLKIDIDLSHSNVDGKQMLIGPFANVDWGKIGDIKVDLQKAIAITCGVDQELIEVTESFPNATGTQHPRLLIQLPATVTVQQVALVQPALENYFDLLHDPEKALPALIQQISDETNEALREVARQCCKRRGGKSLPCQFVITSEHFEQPIETTVEVAKVKTPLATGDEYPMIGVANGFMGDAPILHFIEDVYEEGSIAAKKKKRHISFDLNRYKDEVMGMRHLTATRYVLTVVPCTEDKRQWLKLTGIRLATDCLTNA
jgi:hypothetical protein